MSPSTSCLVPPESLRFVKTALQFTGNGRFAEYLGKRWFRRLVRLCESLAIPGLSLHHALRKHIIEQIVRREIDNGATRVVQIGAGFDSLAYRLHLNFPQVTFVEFDHPSTSQVKRRVISSLGGAADNLSLRSIDLAEPDVRVDLPEPDQRTTMIIEGVLMYLGPSTAKQHLLHLRKQLDPDSLVIFSFMASRAFRHQSPLVNWWLRLAGEPFRWSLPKDEIATFLQCIGFSRSVIHSTGSCDLVSLDRTIARGELLCEAGFSGHHCRWT